MKKIILGALVLTAGLVGLITPTTVQAAKRTRSPYITANDVQYVRLKKTMYVGIYQKSGNTYKKLLKHKGALLELAGTATGKAKDKQGHLIVRASFTSGAVHYQRLKQLKYAAKVDVTPFTKANFTPVKLKAPVRSLLFQAGRGFTAATNYSFTSPAAFYLTLDNYLQAYSSAAMARNAPDGGLYSLDTQLWRPTASVKVDRVTVQGKTTKIDYRRPLKGVPNRKLAKGHYRLTIVHDPTNHYQNFFPVDDTYDSYASWTTYQVNGRPYFVGEAENGLN